MLKLNRLKSPATNGARYYRDMIEFYRKAPSTNPNKLLPNNRGNSFRRV
ncbi:MAG: hypothetical protein PUH24_00565 [Prevotellaceae bacterium]|nr:hypothetical protein [Prevotella sp.]MDD7256776.1 hypothetical protein [Prevotellaceae bacterium]MDY6130813.1 hypothetical protein [Prevotella sp.]